MSMSQHHADKVTSDVHDTDLHVRLVFIVKFLKLEGVVRVHAVDFPVRLEKEIH